MEFINASIDLQQLPQAEAVPYQPIDKKYLTILRLEWLITVLVLTSVAVLLYFFLPAMQRAAAGVSTAAVLLLVLVFQRVAIEKSFPRKAFAVRQKDVIYRYGWLVASVKICPFSRIQNCTLVSGPLESRYGLATLEIFTAGSGGADMRIPGLEKGLAERLRQYILEQIHLEDDKEF